MRVVGDASFRVGWVTWRFTPEEPRIVIAIKATLELVDGGACRFASEPRFVTGDELWEDDPEMSVRYESDLALVKPVGELLVSGTLYTDAEVTERLCAVRVGALQTSFAVVGERFREPNGSISAPLPFTAMPLCWERCFGGPGFAPNPVGRGMRAQPDGRVPLPNIEDPSHLVRAASDRPAPPSFLPVPRGWPERARLMGTYDSSYVKERWPYYPDDFQWSHYQAARPEMRLRDGYWRGDEGLEVRGLDPRTPIVRTRLPGLRPRVFLHGTDDSFTEVGTVLDTVVVEADGPTVYCVWRGSAVVRSERLDDLEHVYLAHEPLDLRAPARTFREAFDAFITRELEEERALAGVEPPSLSPAEVEPDPEPALDLAESALFVDPLAQLRANAIAASAPPELVEQLYAPRPPATTEEREARAIADRAALQAGIAKARELGLHSVADALEGKGPAIELPPEPPAPAETPPLKPEELRREVQRRLQHGEPLSGLILADADLTLLDFTGRDLTGTVLVRCDLRQASFDEAKLEGAVLDGAQLERTTFRKASLRGASLTAVTGEGADFSEATLEDAFGARASLPRALLSGAKAARLELSRSQLEGAVFVGASLEDADLSESNLSAADFTLASLTGLRLHGARAEGANFDQAVLYRVRAAGSNLSRSSLRWCQASEAVFARAVLTGARFTESDLTHASFAEARLDGCELLAVKARSSTFADASLVRARFSGADLLGARFEGACLVEADFRNASLYRAELWRADTRGAHFDGANLAGTKLA